MKALAIGLVLAVVPWIVFHIVDAMNPQAMLVGLGIVTFAVSIVGGIIALFGLVSMVRRSAARRQSPS